MSVWYTYLMKYFAAQIKTTKEDAYIARLEQQMEHRKEEQRFIFPKRRLSIRKKGKTEMELRPVFPGYIFVETENLDTELYNFMRKTPGFYRFLRSNQDVTELYERDLSILKHFMSFGEIAESSSVFFDSNDRIVVEQGPLKGLEGKIIKVDRRKGRAKIQLDLYTDKFLIDLAFTIIGKETTVGAPNENKK